MRPIWRPLHNGEYPPPGPTKLGPKRADISGHMVAPILVHAPPLRCYIFGEGERCLLIEGHSGPHDYEVRMER
jgi:hypothetical protein